MKTNLGTGIIETGLPGQMCHLVRYFRIVHDVSDPVRSISLATFYTKGIGPFRSSNEEHSPIIRVDSDGSPLGKQLM